MHDEGQRSPARCRKNVDFLQGSESQANDTTFSGAYRGPMEDDVPGANGPQARFPFDAVYKALCCHRLTVADILRTYLAAPAGRLTVGSSRVWTSARCAGYRQSGSPATSG